MKKVKKTGVIKHTIRTKDGGTKTLKLGRSLAMALMCTECMGWEENPSECSVPLCPLFPWRVRSRAGYEGDGEVVLDGECAGSGEDSD